MEGNRLRESGGLRIIQENCTQISGKHGTNEGSGTEPDCLYEKQGLEMK